MLSWFPAFWKQMSWPEWQTLRKLLVLATPPLAQQRARISFMELRVGLPVKAVVVFVLTYYLYYSNWFSDLNTTRVLMLEPIRKIFLFYLLANVAGAFVLMGMDRLSLRLVQWSLAGLALLDGLFLAGLTLVTGGFDSPLYWVFPGVIVRTAISLPHAVSQVVLNLLISLSYLWAGLLDISVSQLELKLLDEGDALAYGVEVGTEPFLLRLVLLLLLTVCCYGLQILLDYQRRVRDEAVEFAQRQAQLQATGRLAAEIAHQLKNPLGIINNAAFSLQRGLREDQRALQEQAQIIREEVDRSDRIITELMGYAQLVEGRVERLEVTEELDRAIEQVFPPAAQFPVQVQREYQPPLPPLLMQRSHLAEIFRNLLQNAREILGQGGYVRVRAWAGSEYNVLVSFEDNGLGIPAEHLEKIFEPYFTTKKTGTGLGLSIVRHNTEIYGGTVRVESELGKGTCFTLDFPAKTAMRFRQ